MPSQDAALDNPIDLPEKDAFARWEFSRRIAATIIGLDNSTGAPVLGLFGPWGSGKTTVLNLVQHALNKDWPNKFSVHRFNPWLYSNTESLLSDFFALIANEVGVSSKKDSAEAGRMMTNYGMALGVLPVVGPALMKFTEAVGKEMMLDTIQAQHDRLAAHMASHERRILVIIDDLDRIDRDEVMLILKLVRLAANLPNITYLLAFDEERISVIAGQVYGEQSDGRHFLEKIIQYPFSLPRLDKDDLQSYVLDQLRHCCRAVMINLPKQGWDTVDVLATELVQTLLTTPRQAIRYTNALRFALPMLKGEVDPIDQMIIEATRILAPSVYSFISRLDKVTSHSLDLSRFKDQELSGKKLTEWDAGMTIARMLFRSSPESTKSIEEPRIKRRLFSYTIARDDLSDGEINALVARAGLIEDEALTGAVIYFLENKRSAFLRGILQATMTESTCICFARALTKSAPINSFGSAVADVFFFQQLASAIVQIFSRSRLKGDLRRRELGMILSATENLAFAQFLRNRFGINENHDLKARQGIYGHLINSESIINEEDTRSTIDFLLNALVPRIAAQAASHPPYEIYAPADSLSLLKEWHHGDSEREKAWLTSRVKTFPAEAEAFLSLFEGQLSEYASIVQLVDGDVLFTALITHFGDTLVDAAFNESAGVMAALTFIEAHSAQRTS